MDHETPGDYLTDDSVADAPSALGDRRIDVPCQLDVLRGRTGVVEHALANGQCYVPDNPAWCGGTSEVDQILAGYGLSAHVEQAESLEDLAADIEQDRGVMTEANAGVPPNDLTAFNFGAVKHAVVVTGVARDPETGEAQVFFINNSRKGHSAYFADASLLTQARPKACPSGVSVVTDAVRGHAQGSAS